MQHPMTTRTGVAVLVLGLGLLVAAWHVTGTHGPLLTAPGMNVVTEGSARIRQGDTVTVGSMVGCLDKPGSITIDTIEPVHAVGLRVTGWGLRPNPFWKPPGSPNAAHVGGQIGIERTTLPRLGFTTSHTIDVKCGHHGEGYELAVQVEKTTAGEAGASGWVVTYRSEGETKKFGFTLAVKLCNEKVSWSKKCNALTV